MATENRAGIALALCGDAAQAQAQIAEAIKQYPKFTTVNEIYLPLIRAELEIQRGNRTQAIRNERFYTTTTCILLSNNPGFLDRAGSAIPLPQ